MKKQFWFGLVAAILSITISYVLLEIGITFLVYSRGYYLSTLDPAYQKKLALQDPPGYTEKQLYDCDPKVGHKQTPSNSGFWRGFAYPQAEFRHPIFINAEGFRSSQDYSEIRSPRVAVIGDSFVQGLQVREQDTFLKVAERQLREAGNNVTLLNYGECGTGTASQFRIFEEYVLKSRPQVVVLSVYVNDLTDNSPSYWHEKPFLVPRYTVGADGEFHLEDFECAGPVKGSGTISLPAGKMSVGEKAVTAIASGLEKNSFSLALRFLAVFLKDSFLPNYEYEPAFDIYKRNYPPALQESLRFTVFLIDQMNKKCREAGIKFFVVMVPAPEQASPSMWEQYVKKRRGALAVADFDLGNPQQRLLPQLAARGIKVVDWMAAYRQQAKKELLYYPKDRHFNANGHRLAGDLLAQQLKEYLAAP